MKNNLILTFNEFSKLNESKSEQLNVGDVVYDKEHDSYGIVLLPEERGEVKLTSDGNVDVSKCQKLSKSEVIELVNTDKITSPSDIFILYKLNYIKFDIVDDKTIRKSINSAEQTIKNFDLLKKPIELTFTEVDSDTGNLLYNGSNGEEYVSIGGIIFTLEESGEPSTPFRNTIFKKGTPIYNPDDRFGRNPEKLKMNV